MAMKRWNRWRGGGVAAMLIGALLLALLTTESSLPADDEAKAAALPADLAKIPSDGMAVVSGRIADLWNSELLKPAREKIKKEIAEVPEGFRKRFFLPLEEIERMTLALLDPPPTTEEPLFFVRTVKPYDLAKILAAHKNAKAKKYKEETLYAGNENWTVYPLDDRSLVYGKFDALRALIDRPQAKPEGNLAAALRLAAGKHSAVYGMNVKMFNDGIGNRLPGEVDPFRPLLQALSASLVVDLGAESGIAATLNFAAEKDAGAAVKPAQTGLVLLRAGVERIVTETSKEKYTAGVIELLKQLQEPLKAARIEQKGETLRASVHIKFDPSAAGLAVLEGVRKARESAARTQSTNNLKQIALAMHNYADTMRGRLPAHATYDKNGKPLLSWRVMILPYLAEQNLYNQFHLNEPWDSEHNKKLLIRMPRTYASPQDEKTLKDHTTHYQGLVGKGAFFEGKKGLRFPADFTDGTSNTIMIVEGSNAVPWTKPDDIPFDPAKPLPKLGLPGAPGFLASLCDGSVRFFTPKLTQQTLRLLITRNDGLPLGADF